jgi:Domain of unknown function (DUF4398)
MSRTMSWSRTLAGFAGAALLGTGCASVPAPKGEIAKADLALKNAEAVNAAEIDPLDARLARENLEKAKLEMQKDEYTKARRLAETAEVDAMVAEAKARSTRAQQRTQQLKQDVQQLQSGSKAGGVK